MELKPDLQVSVPVAQSIVDEAVSDRVVTAVSRLYGGEIAAIHEIAFTDPAHRPLVLKIYPDELRWKLQKEVAVISLIQDRLSVPAPRILFSDDTKRLLPLGFTLMTKLDGAGLGQLEKGLSPEQRAAAYRQIGQLLREFHRIPMEAFGYIGPAGIWTAHSTNQDYLTAQFQRKLKEFTGRGGETRLAERVARHVAEREQLLKGCSQAVLCHNDLHAGNVLATIRDEEVRLTGVLDFEGALAGDPLMDVAKALFYLDPACMRALLDGYGELDRERGPEALDVYRLYFVLELWCWMAQIGRTERLEKLAVELEARVG
jgi:aminoglycoside phosphotransferase (APT) family kinase protein